MDDDDHSITNALIKKHLAGFAEINDSGFMQNDDGDVHTKTITKYVDFWNEHELKIDLDMAFYADGGGVAWVWIELKHKLSDNTNALFEDQLEIWYEGAEWPTIEQIKKDVSELVQGKLDQLKTLKFEM